MTDAISCIRVLLADQLCIVQARCLVHWNTVKNGNGTTEQQLHDARNTERQHTCDGEFSSKIRHNEKKAVRRLVRTENVGNRSKIAVGLRKTT